MKSHEKKDAKAAYEKESKSMSPRKNRAGMPKEIQTNWDDSCDSEDHYSDISPTIKKVKKEKAARIQLTPNTMAETSNNSTTSTSSVKNLKLEEEFMMHYNKSLAKVLDQTNNSSEDSPLKSILNLQFLTISDLQTAVPVTVNTSANVASKTEDYFDLFDSNHQHGGLIISQPEKQTAETFDEYKPIYGFLEQGCLPQELPLSWEHNTATNFSEFCVQDSSVNPIEKAQSADTNDTNQIGMNIEIALDNFGLKSFQEANDMIDYDLEKLRETRTRKISLESDGGYSRDRKFSFGLQREVSESHFMRDFLESTPLESFF